MARKKKKKFPYKYLRPEQLEELNSQSNDELLLESHKQQKEVSAYEKLKKDDTTLSDLKKQISEHKKNHDNRKRLTELANEKKELEDEIKSEIEDVILDKKELEGGHNDNIKASKERLKAITKILSDRQV